MHLLYEPQIIVTLINKLLYNVSIVMQLSLCIKLLYQIYHFVKIVKKKIKINELLH